MFTQEILLIAAVGILVGAAHGWFDRKWFTTQLIPRLFAACCVATPAALVIWSALCFPATLRSDVLPLTVVGLLGALIATPLAALSCRLMQVWTEPS